MMERHLESFAAAVALWTLVTLPRKLIRILLMWKFCLKSFVLVAVLECSFGNIFIPITEISVAKTEISITGPARLPSYEHIEIFTKERMARGDLGKPAQLTGLI